MPAPRSTRSEGGTRQCGPRNSRRFILEVQICLRDQQRGVMESQPDPYKFSPRLSPRSLLLHPHQRRVDAHGVGQLLLGRRRHRPCDRRGRPGPGTSCVPACSRSVIFACQPHQCPGWPAAARHPRTRAIGAGLDEIGQRVRPPTPPWSTRSGRPANLAFFAIGGRPVEDGGTGIAARRAGRAPGARQATWSRRHRTRGRAGRVPAPRRSVPRPAGRWRPGPVAVLVGVCAASCSALRCGSPVVDERHRHLGHVQRDRERHRQPC